MMSTTIFSVPSERRFKTFEINKSKNLEKKRDFCDKPFSQYVINDSGKQVTANLNTVAYEALKNNTIFVLSTSGDVTLASPTIAAEDRETATVETQYFLRLCSNSVVSNLKTAYQVTVTFYHTNCSISIQSYQNKDDFLSDGRSPAQAFLLDYLSPALDFIKTKVDVPKESFNIKQMINEALGGNKKKTINQWDCQICRAPQPPHSNRTSKFRSCDVCDKIFHIQCVNKTRDKKHQIREKFKFFSCASCDTSTVSSLIHPQISLTPRASSSPSNYSSVASIHASPSLRSTLSAASRTFSMPSPPTPMLPPHIPDMSTPPPPLGTIPNGTITVQPHLVTNFPNIIQEQANQTQNYFHSIPRIPTFMQPEVGIALEHNKTEDLSISATVPTQTGVIPAKTQKSNKLTVKISEADIKSHPLYKNLQTQVETCRGINVQLSTKSTRLEETVRILETKNLYQKEEIQKLKGINEGILNSRIEKTHQRIDEKTDPRVLLLENENLATKFKLMEQNFESQLSLFKVEINNKMACLQNNFSTKDNQRNQPTKCKETNRIKILSGEVDALAVRIRNVEIKTDENSKQIMKKTEANVSTPKDHIGYLPYEPI